MSSGQLVYILLRQSDGRRAPEGKITIVTKGELLVPISDADQANTRDDGNRPNYHVFKNPSVSLYCGAHYVAPLPDAQHHYFIPLRPFGRVQEFFNEEKKEWVFDLKSGDFVTFSKAKNILFAKGKIRHVGSVPDKAGVFFGIEILVSDCSTHKTCCIYVSVG